MSGSNMIKPGLFLWHLHATSPGCRLLSLAILKLSLIDDGSGFVTDHAAMMH